MRSVLNWLRTSGLAAAVLAGAMATNAMAGVVINIAQSGSNVVATVSGSLSTLGGGIAGGSSLGGDSAITIDYTMGSLEQFRIKNAGFQLLNTYAISFTSGPGSWSNNSFYNIADSYNLAGVNYFSVGTEFYLASSYVFGTAITGTATWNNKTLSQLGLTNLGTYVYTVGSGGSTDTITIVMSSGGGGGAVPEPTSMAIFGLGALGFAYRNRRKLVK